MKSRSWQISFCMIFFNVLVFFSALQNIGDQNTQWVIYDHLTMNHLPLMIRPSFLPCVHMHLSWMGSSKGFGLMWMRGQGGERVLEGQFITCPQCELTLTTSVRRALAASHINDDLWENRAGLARFSVYFPCGTNLRPPTFSNCIFFSRQGRCLELKSNCRPSIVIVVFFFRKRGCHWMRY